MHPQGADEAKGHHYCKGQGEDLRCCHCGDESPYRMVLARWCPYAIRPARKVAGVKPDA